MSHDFVDRAAPFLYAMQRAFYAAELWPAWDEVAEWRKQSAIASVLEILSAPDREADGPADAAYRAAILALAGDEQLLVARHSGADPGRLIIAEHIIDAYAIQPLIAQDGALSLHFEALGVTVKTDETLQTQAELFTDPASRVTNRAGIKVWRDLLAAELAKAEAALTEN